MTLFLMFITVCLIAIVIVLYLQLKNAKQEKLALQRNYEEKLAHSVNLMPVIEESQTRLGLSFTLFTDRVNQSIKESERYNLHLGLVILRIDHLDELNASLSPQAREQLLEEVAGRLQACIRQVDSLSRSQDHFVILLTQLTKPEMAAIVIQRLLAVFEQAFKIAGQEWHLRAYAGISIYPNDGLEMTILLENAEYALHLAKQKGGQHYQFYQEQLHAQSQRDLALYNSLRSDRIFQELVLYYQPIINSQTEDVFCMEALLYWQHPQFGLIAPQELMHYAKRQETLNTLSEWALQKACQQFLEWRQSGFNPQYLGFTLSSKQLENTQFIYRISQILQEKQFPPQCLLLQINGEMGIVETNVLEKSFNRLKYLGIKLAISHFGLGALSLLHLKFFPVDYLKLDPLWVKNFNAEVRTGRLIKAILFLAESICAQIIIPGVESKDQIQSLKELGCLLIQGDVIAPPLQELEAMQKI